MWACLHINQGVLGFMLLLLLHCRVQLLFMHSLQLCRQICCCANRSLHLLVQIAIQQRKALLHAAATTAAAAATVKHLLPLLPLPIQLMQKLFVLLVLHNSSSRVQVPPGEASLPLLLGGGERHVCAAAAVAEAAGRQRQLASTAGALKCSCWRKARLYQALLLLHRPHELRATAALPVLLLLQMTLHIPLPPTLLLLLLIFFIIILIITSLLLLLSLPQTAKSSSERSIMRSSKPLTACIAAATSQHSP
jgi:hypothetical protein